MNHELQPTTASSLTLMNPFDVMFDDNSFNRLEKIASLMASGRSTIPKHLQGNVGDCFAITMQAFRWGIDPYAAAQKTHLINGIIGYEAQLVNAIIIKNAPVTGRPQYEWFGPWEKIIGKFKKVTSATKKDDNGKPKEYIVPDWDMKDETGLGIRVSATIQSEDQPRVLELLLTQVRTRNSTLWTEDPKQQIAYLAIKRWSRLHTPDVIMGVYTPDEIDDVQEIVVNETPRDSSGAPVDASTEAMLDKLNKKPAKPKEEKPPINSTAEQVTDLAEVMAAIAKMYKKPSREATIELINKLTDPQDRATAEAEFKKRLDEIKAKVEAAKSTAAKQPDPDPLADWYAAINACATADDLDSLIASMPEAVYELTEAAREKKVMSLPVAGDDDDFNME